VLLNSIRKRTPQPSSNMLPNGVEHVREQMETYSPANRKKKNKKNAPPRFLHEKIFRISFHINREKNRLKGCGFCDFRRTSLQNVENETRKNIRPTTGSTRASIQAIPRLNRFFSRSACIRARPHWGHTHLRRL